MCSRKMPSKNLAVASKMIVDLKVESSKELQDFDLLRYDAKKQAMVPFSKADFIKLFGFNLQEIKTAIENTNKRLGQNESNIKMVADLTVKNVEKNNSYEETIIG